MKRRQFIQGLGVGLAAATLGCATPLRGSPAKVVVVGGGFGGATVAKHLRIGSQGAVEVTLVEPNPNFISCPAANMVLSGARQMADITFSYRNLAHRHGIRLIPDWVQAIETEQRTVRLAGGQILRYDRLVVSPGIDFIWEQLPGMRSAAAREQVLHGWKAGDQFLRLRRQILSMPDGGLFVISIPQAPLRCPPAPYERACLIADYFLRINSKSRVLILDGNDDVLAEASLFKQAWAERYRDVIEYRPGFVVADVDADANTVISEFDDKVQAAVLNLIPPQRAGDIAFQSGLANINRRWCEVDFLSFASTQAEHVHVLGDAIQIAPLMPKSAQMASHQGQVCALAVLALLKGNMPDRQASLRNICYSFVSAHEAMHVQSIHRYDPSQQTFLSVPGRSETSMHASVAEGDAALESMRRLWDDCLT